MDVGDVMTRAIRTCRLNDSLDTVVQIMWNNDCGAVPVVDAQGELVAMITDRDICVAAHMQGRPLSCILVRSAASRNVCSVRDSSNVDAVLALMQEHQIRRVPVVDGSRRPVGIVAMSDLIRHSRGVSRHLDALDQDAIIRTLAAVSRPSVPHLGAAA